MSSVSRYVTLEEARLFLKQIFPVLSLLVELKKFLDARNYDIYTHTYFGGAGPNGMKHYPPELEELVGILERFAAYGVLVKSLEEGLIDFPCIRNPGEEVYLCYRLGEEDILYWHPVESGFAGRRSTTEL